MKSVIGKIDFWQRIQKVIKVQRQWCLGIYVQDRNIYVAEVCRRENSYCLMSCDTIKVELDEELSSELVAERVKQLCLQKHILTENVAFCLPEGSLWCLQMKLPPMPEHEVAEAVKWQIEAKDPFNGDKYWHEYLRNQSGDVYAAAISVNDGEELRNNFLEYDLFLRSLTLCPGHMEEYLSAEGIVVPEGEMDIDSAFAERMLQKQEMIAIYTAMSALQHNFLINVMPPVYRMEQIAWNKLSCIVVAAGLVLSVMFFSIGFLQLNQSRQELNSLNSALAMTERQEKQLQDLQARQLRLVNKEKILALLTMERSSAYALLVHFGTLSSQGIRLTGIASNDKGMFNCQGKADSYQALVVYLKEINEQDQYFQGGASLLESKLDEHGQLDFIIRVQVNKD